MIKVANWIFKNWYKDGVPGKIKIIFFLIGFVVVFNILISAKASYVKQEAASLDCSYLDELGWE